MELFVLKFRRFWLDAITIERCCLSLEEVCDQVNLPEEQGLGRYRNPFYPGVPGGGSC